MEADTLAGDRLEAIDGNVSFASSRLVTEGKVRYTPSAPASRSTDIAVASSSSNSVQPTAAESDANRA
jgi:hypothetical protein